VDYEPPRRQRSRRRRIEDLEDYLADLEQELAHVRGELARHRGDAGETG